MSTAIIAGRIAEAYETIAPAGGYAGIREIREALADIPARDLDGTLAKMYAEQLIDLAPRSCQALLTPADRAAAVTAGGEAKHLIAWAR
jgi:hypothetical protein